MKNLKVLLFALTIIFFSCEKDETNTEDTNSEAVEAAVNYVFNAESAENAIDEVALYSSSFFGIGQITSGKGGALKGHSGFFKECAEINVTEDGDTITTVITFQDGCLDRYGNEITGTITKVETKGDTSSENEVTITDLTINGFVVNGTKSFTHTKANAAGNPEMEGTVNITVETDEGTITIIGNKKMEVTAGGDTDTWEDDERTITGKRSITKASGDTIVVEITTALVKPAACKYVASGIKEITTTDGTASIDFGDGTCDAIATLTKPDGTTTEIELKRKRKKH